MAKLKGQDVSVSLNEKDMDRVIRLCAGVPRSVPMIMARSLNRTATGSKALVAKEISGKVRLTQAVVKKGIKLEKATRAKWQAVLDITTRRIPLVQFGARQIKKGTSYLIQRAGGRKKVEHAFIVTMPSSGHKGVFRRIRQAPRLPIGELFGPSIAGVFEEAGTIAGRVQAESGDRLRKNLDQQIDFALKKVAERKGA